MRPETSTATLAGRLTHSLRAGALQAALVHLAFLAAFFWTPLSRFDEVHFSSADLTQGCTLTRIEAGHSPGNRLQSDAVTQMQPWLMLNRAALADGELPLWNPWNGAGCPHFANYQSAVFSPFSLPFYVVPFKAALLASAALKLFVLGFFTYLFLKELGLGQVAALVGGLVFMFAGHNVLLLYFPHVGALSVLPVGLLFAEKALKRFERGLASGRRERLFGPLCGLSLAILAGLLAGNPEPFYFGVLFVGAWAAVRLLVLAFGRRARPFELAGLAAKLVLAAAIGLGLAAFQVLPFLEYLRESRLIEERSFRQTPLDATLWPLAMFPDALGNPSSPYNLSEEVPPPNYEHVNMIYTGGLALLLAVVMPLSVRRDRLVAFFSAALVVWVVYAHDVFGALDLFGLIPTLDRAPPNRSQGLWNFAVACSVALYIDRASAVGRRGLAAAAAVFAAGLTALVACLIGADRLIEQFATFPSLTHHRFLDIVPPHITRMSALFLAGTLAAAALWVARASWLRAALGLSIGLVAFLQTGHLLKDYNPVCEDRFFFPVTPEIEILQRHVGKDRLAILGEDTLPPDSNLAYGINTIASYDGMWVRDLDLLYRDHFGNTNNWRPILRGSEASLKLFGVQWVLAKWDWNFIDSGLMDLLPERGQVLNRVEILPGQPVTQTFDSERRGLQALMVVLGSWPSARPCAVRVSLLDVASGATVFERTLTREEIRANINEHSVWPQDPRTDPKGRPVVLRFDPIPDSYLRKYKIVFECDDAIPGDGVSTWSRPLLAYGAGTGTHGTRRLSGELLFDFSFNYHRFEKVADVAEYSLYRYLGSLSRWWMVSDAVVAANENKALEFLRTPSFDPKNLVVLDGTDPVAERLAASTGAAEAARKRVVKFTDSEFVYLISEDGTKLIHIDDEATFLANRFSWTQIEMLPASERARFTLVPDTDLAEKQRLGLRLIKTDKNPDPEILLETPTRLRWRVTRSTPGFLVVSQTYFPGWKARVGGAEAPVLRANLAFDAIPVPEGTSEVELAYEPDSLQLGLWIGAASALAGALAWVFSRYGGRARQGTAHIVTVPPA